MKSAEAAAPSFRGLTKTRAREPDCGPAEPKLCPVWLEEGEQALRTAARKSPARFIAVAASLIPQHFKLEHEHKVLHITEEEVERRLLELAALIHDEAASTPA